ncbi:protocatechuate dioxygenase [Pilimelia anulata]|uniref:Protocatechuate dioxygenase n=1 Tax=Pilimelia anulata TaxID=53371 RepID=A0A8J3FCG5_9ACTN|nr:intradiol ring-cleavage dioxygenase [Pilimelia anulata]GGK00229.1 protocatechuate dioxygenase [Pilimelia anulata]
MHEHDDHEGQRVSRRRIIAGAGSVGFGALIAAASTGSATARSVDGGQVPVRPLDARIDPAVFDGVGACQLTKAAMEGPYWFDAKKIRSDIREDKRGTLLRVAIKVQDRNCNPIPNAVAEIWHCDHMGAYSGFDRARVGPFPATDPQTPTRYLRGAQVTDANGAVEFVTIWPGWYPGRCVHIHNMFHVNKRRVLTTQTYFDETLNSSVHAEAPYTEHKGNRTRNEQDSIFLPEGIMKVTREADGWRAVAVFTVPT